MKAILTYHSIDDSGSVVSTGPAAFRRQIEWLSRSDVRILGLEALVSDDGAGDAVAITFDDAFENVARDAWPVLTDNGMTATVFVPTAHAGGVNAWESGADVPKLSLMGWSTLARLAEAGAAIGSHSATHPDLTRLDAATLEDELDRAIDCIRKETGRAAAVFAYPYGRFDARVVEAVAARHRLAVTTEYRTLTAGEAPAELPRLDAYYFRRPGLLESFGSPRFERYVAMRRGMRRIRRFLSRD